MRLNDAKFCVDCEEIFVGKPCPRCGRDISSMRLSVWLTSLQCPKGMQYLGQKVRAEAAA